MKETRKESYVLGVDVGSTSIGWAVVGLTEGNPVGLTAAGVRVFQAGVVGNLSAGRADSRAATRRQARQQRRMADRRARRIVKVYHILQRAGLLPAGDVEQTIPALDRQLIERHAGNVPATYPPDLLHHVLPYWLRARALDHPLESHELGRALYHLAQRRGFLSNRRARPKGADDKEGVVKAGINELQAAMQATGARTLGEYFSTLDPRTERIRNNYTGRAMYEDEFERVWTAQVPHHSAVLNDALKIRLHKAIFYQRPLASTAGLIGRCELEPGRRRAPWALLLAQRFRLFQMVNDTRVINPDGTERQFTEEERSGLLAQLERKDKLTFGQARRALTLPRGSAFNWEAGGEKRFIGNTTNGRLAKVFGERWWELSDAERRAVVEDVRSIQRPETLAERGRRVWGLDEEAAQSLADLRLEDGYCAHSRQALRRLVPLMEQGVPYTQALDKEYPQQRQVAKPLDAVPPLDGTDVDVRNPAVHRVLTELRKVVNALVRRYGKPAQVRIELARDLRRSAQQRQRSWKRNRENQGLRERAAERMVKEAGITDPTRRDIEKVLLADECEWTCPYTGRVIGWQALFGPQPQFDIEHIIPLSRSLNDSFINKTLCYVPENRSVKGNRSPFEAYGHDERRWHEIIERVKRFQGTARIEKLRRFQEREPEKLDEIASRELNDTRYASRLAMQYVGLLYGGVVDADGVRRVQASRGGTTAFLRDLWGMNSVLGDEDRKQRDDHRHHAVDAIAVALTEPSAVRLISQSAADAQRQKRRRFGAVPLPWPAFPDDVREVIGSIHVSHAARRRVRGALHEETFQRVVEWDQHGQPAGVHVRKPLQEVSANEVEAVVDPAVRAAVCEALGRAGKPPKQAFADSANHPFLSSRGGQRIPIHRVRIRRAASPVPFGSGRAVRHALPGANHHMEIVEVRDRRGRPKWEGRLVPLYEAVRRLRAGEPVLRRPQAESERFVFSLAPGDAFQLAGPEGPAGLFICRSVSAGVVEFVYATDARPKTEIKGAGEWFTRSPERLRQLACRKMTVTPIGDVVPAND